MNSSDQASGDEGPSGATQLLESIRAIRASVGDGLNDSELTQLLQQSALPKEAGFTFLSYSEGCVTLGVPSQNLADWYPEQGWIRAGKEQVARAIGQKYGLSLCEPPDQSASTLIPHSASRAVHHHLELTNQVETVVVAHPRYLKIRLLGAAPEARYRRDVQAPIELGPDILRDLCELYLS